MAAAPVASLDPEVTRMRKLVKTSACSPAGAATFVADPVQAANANADFGQHVTTCAQTMRFDGSAGRANTRASRDGTTPARSTVA